MKSLAAFTFALLLCAVPMLAQSQTVWRCGPDGRSFSDVPCPQGRAMDIALEPRPAADVLAAQRLAAQDRRQADQLERERRLHEAAARGNGLGGFAPVQRPVMPVARPVVKRKRPARSLATEEADIWRAAVPGSRRAKG